MSNSTTNTKLTLASLLTIAGTHFITPISVAANIDDQPNILMVLSSYGEKNADGELVKPGYEFDEMSKSYLVFKAAGANVTFASPSGGKLIADKYDANKAYNQAFLADDKAVQLLSTSIKLNHVNTKNYDAVYVVGGKGPMFDLATNDDVKQVIKAVYQDNGVVGAVCHGPAALLDIKLNNGTYLVAGKRISGFTNQEETAFTKKWQLPFYLEDKLIEQGANYRKDGLMLNQVSIDGRIITGQNPFSTADAAKAMVAELGLATDKLPEFKDDRTIKLAEQFFADRTSALQEFKQNQAQYDTMLLGMLGLYQSKFATSQAELDVAILLMETTQQAINHPMLDTAIAKAYLNKNELAKATKVLKTSQQKHPDNETIIAMLKGLAE